LALFRDRSGVVVRRRDADTELASGDYFFFQSD
jgi:hypothetical protein